VSFTLFVPGSIDQLTGGYLFARHVVDGLAARGSPVAVIELAGRFPDADVEASAACATALATLPGGARAVIDGLALAGFGDCLAREAPRLRLIVWVHHPLADETGLATADRARFHAIEAKLLPLSAGVICPSQCTADAVARYGVDPMRIAIAPPGTKQPAQQRTTARDDRAPRLLTVATVTPRKGHLVLIEALARLREKAWQLRCIGSTSRDPAHVAALRRAIAAQGLDARVSLADEMPQEALAAAYDDADIFVLPSFHEGYGMAFAEALAHGLPIVATRAGAIPETVPESAGVLVAPGDVAALASALAQLLDDRALLARLTRGAASAGAKLPTWDGAITQWARAIERLFQ
jgi:glycosyltransferase involved in cell wall biosynthesis